MSKTSEYWKAYRLKNRDKLRSYERTRNARRNGARKPLEASIQPLPNQVKEAIPEAPKPIPEPKRCQAPYCKNVGKEVLVHGLKAWLCVEHG